MVKETKMGDQNMTDSIFSKSPNVVFRQIGDESILIPVANEVGDLSNIYNLNEIGTKIWGLIDGQRNVTEICELIADEYDVQMNDVVNDMSEFIGNLDDIRFLQETHD